MCTRSSKRKQSENGTDSGEVENCRINCERNGCKNEQSPKKESESDSSGLNDKENPQVSKRIKRDNLEVRNRVKCKKISSAEENDVDMFLKTEKELVEIPELKLKEDEGYTIAFTHEKDTPGHLYFGPEKRFRCEKCHVLFKMCGALNNHYITHLSEAEAMNMERFTCTYCNIQYPSFLGRLHINCAPSTCPYGCGKVLNSRMAYNNHIVNHEPVLAICDVCGKEMRKRTLKRHKAILHGDEKIPCQHCDKVFTRRYSRK